MSDEARVPLLAPENVDGRVRAIFDGFMRERGNVPNLFRAAAHRPPIVESLMAHMRAVMGAGEVSTLLKELLSVRVSHINVCDY